MAIIRIATALGRLGLGMGATALRLRHDRKVALKAFRQALHEKGLPHEVVQQLSEAYPQVELGKFMRDRSGPTVLPASDEVEG